MKKLVYLIPILFLLSCDFGPTAQDAVNYNDTIIMEQIAIVDKIDSLDATFTNYISKEMKMAHNEALKQTEKSINKIEKLGKFDNSNEYKNRAIELFNSYKDILENDFNKLIEIYSLPDSLYTKKEQKEWKEIYNNAYDKMDAGLIEFNNYQKTFAAKYNFDIIPDSSYNK